MIIDKNTKISHLIKENPKAIDVIASINKNFKKLKNPVLRKLLAPRVTISDAARIGGTTVDVFFDALSKIGFEYQHIGSTDTETHSDVKEEKLWNIDKARIRELDVRPVIDAGNDPLKTILETVSKLKQDETLMIINSFEPVPLINHLKEKGYKAHVEIPEKGIVHTFFLKTDQGIIPDSKETNNTDMNEFELMTSQFGENIKTIDVRQLEMPEPMVTILQEIENLPEGFALYVHHKRVPQFLLPELEKRDFNILSTEVDKNNVDLLIYKNA